MIAIIQRVSEASVTVDGTVVGAIGNGFMVLLGVARGDTEADADLLVNKIAKLRVFKDAEDKMNLSLADIGGGVLVVPNFTLLASCRRGTRPDFMNSESPSEANRLFVYFCERMQEQAPIVERGIFGADMKVSLLNDGPVTIPIDSAVLKLPKKAAHQQNFEEIP